MGRRFGGKIPAPAASKAAPSRPSQPSRLLGQRIPWCPQKSWAGTGGFIVFAAATSLGFARLFQYQGWAAAGQRGGVWARVLGTAAVSAAAETLPVPEGWDNLVVFVAALAADWWVCRRRGLAL